MKNVFLIAAVISVLSIVSLATSREMQPSVDGVSYSEDSEALTRQLFVNGTITEEEAVAILNEHTQYYDTDSKFFPIDCNFSVIDGSGTNRPPEDCTEPPVGQNWDINCPPGGTWCGIVVVVPETCPNVSLRGVWVFRKSCDGSPIGQYTLNGLYVNYTSVQHY